MTSKISKIYIMNFGSRTISVINRIAPEISRVIGQACDVGRNIGQVVKHSRNIGSIANQISGGRLSQSPLVFFLSFKPKAETMIPGAASDSHDVVECRLCDGCQESTHITKTSIPSSAITYAAVHICDPMISSISSETLVNTIFMMIVEIIEYCEKVHTFLLLY
jgi:hypothetical protein